MKTLALLRHAKSSWDDAGISDFDRPLKPRGERASALIGAEMRRRGLAFDLVVASRARRVVETIGHLERGYDAPLRARFDERVYGATAERLLAALRQMPADAERILLIGHNPGLQELASRLAAQSDPKRDAILDHYPTAALALIALPVESWAEIQPGSGEITDFLKPRELPQRHG